MTFPSTKTRWPLQEKDITSALCEKCALCCSMEIKPKWADERMMKALKVMVEGHENVKFLGDGIRITCSHLKESKCDIYFRRPQLCADFNCVSWAKVSNNLNQYNQVLEKLNIL